MALVPDTWTGNQDDGDPLSGVNNMAYLTALRTGVNAIDNSQIIAGAAIDGSKLADTSVSTAKLANNSVTEGKLLKADATNGVKVMSTAASQRKENWGKKAFTVINATPSISVTVTFATDSADGGTAFANATDLTIVCTLETTVVEVLVCDINTITATTFNAVVRTAGGGNVAANRTGNVHWHAIGRTA